MAENGKIIAINKMVKILVIYCHNITGYRASRLQVTGLHRAPRAKKYTNNDKFIPVNFCRDHSLKWKELLYGWHWLDLSKEENMLFVCNEEVESNLVKLETSCTVILPPSVSVLWLMLLMCKARYFLAWICDMARIILSTKYVWYKRHLNRKSSLRTLSQEHKSHTNRQVQAILSQRATLDFFPKFLLEKFKTDLIVGVVVISSHWQRLLRDSKFDSGQFFKRTLRS